MSINFYPYPVPFTLTIYNGEQKQMVKNVKDISAAAVLISAATAFVIGILFLIIPFAQRMFELAQGH